MGSSIAVSSNGRHRVTIQRLGESTMPPPLVFEYVGEWSADIRQESESVRSNPALFAMLAGAPVEVWKDLPGDTEEFVSGPTLIHLVISGHGVEILDVDKVVVTMKARP